MDYIKIYTKFLRKFLRIKKPISMVLDCSNGATSVVLRDLFPKKIKGIDVRFINDKPDGNFPAHGPNPSATGALNDLRRSVLRHKASLGAIFDADGDRVLFINNRGDLISSDEIVLLIGLKSKRIVLTPNSGYLPRNTLGRKGIKIFPSRVGHHFVKKAMRHYRADFGAEVSGHYYFKDFFYADSGIVTLLLLMSRVSELESSISNWQLKLPQNWRSGEINIAVPNKKKALISFESTFKRQAHSISKLDGIKMEFGSGDEAWWCLVRPSQNDDVLRINMEAKNKQIFNLAQKSIRNFIRKVNGRLYHK